MSDKGDVAPDCWDDCWDDDDNYEAAFANLLEDCIRHNASKGSDSDAAVYRGCIHALAKRLTADFQKPEVVAQVAACELLAAAGWFSNDETAIRH